MGRGRDLGRGPEPQSPALRPTLASARRGDPRVWDAHPAEYLSPGRRLARPGLGDRRTRLDRRRRRGLELSPGGHRRPGGVARGVRVSHPTRESDPGGHGVLQRRDPGAGPRSAADVRGHWQPDRPVHSAQVGRGTARPVLHPLTGYALYRRVRWLLQATEPGLGESAGLHPCGAAGQAVPGVHSPRRPSRNHRRIAEAPGRNRHQRF